MQSDFKPVVYLKNGCPFCFKLRVALLELKMLDDLEIRTFTEGTPEGDEIRNVLSAKMSRVMFPTVELSPGKFKSESDELIAYFAELKNVVPENLPTLSAYINGPFKKLMALSKENKALKRAMDSHA